MMAMTAEQTRALPDDKLLAKIAEEASEVGKAALKHFAHGAQPLADGVQYDNVGDVLTEVSQLSGFVAEYKTRFRPAPATPLRVQILEEGARITNGSRDASYGPPKVNLACSGELKAVFRKHMRRDLSPGELEAIDMVLTKIGRVATSPQPVRDTYVDGATYFAIAGEIALDTP